MNIGLDRLILHGDLDMPNDREIRGLVVFAHGSGSSRLSPRNRFVAKFLQENGFATLLFDLLTEEEDKDYNVRFDIKLLSRRLVQTTHWVKELRDLKSISTGYFGASTGAAAALIAAVELGNDAVKAVVSRGGRVDMALGYLRRVFVPTLLIVGARDGEVVKLNRSALKEIKSERKQLTIVPGASHLFEEPGALEQVAGLAVEWFQEYL